MESMGHPIYKWNANEGQRDPAKSEVMEGLEAYCARIDEGLVMSRERSTIISSVSLPPSYGTCERVSCPKPLHCWRHSVTIPSNVNQFLVSAKSLEFRLNLVKCRNEELYNFFIYYFLSYFPIFYCYFSF